MKKEYVSFIAFWLVNAVLIYLFSKLFAGRFELGTMFVNKTIAVFSSSLVLTLSIFLSEPLIKKFGITLKDNLNMLLFYFLVNYVSLWVIARLAPWTGLGIESAMWVFVLALVLNFAQYLAWSGVEKLQN